MSVTMDSFVVTDIFNRYVYLILTRNWGKVIIVKYQQKIDLLCL